MICIYIVVIIFFYFKEAEMQSSSIVEENCSIKEGEKSMGMVISKREELSNMLVVDLRNMASTYGIKNVKKYKKQELVDMICEIIDGQKPTVVDEEAEATVAVEEDDNNIETVTDELSEEEIAERRMPYVENAPIDTIVAFKLPTGKVKSAKIINKSTKNRKLKVETAYGAQFIIPYDSVIWVKTGTRWPKGVYNLLKGNHNGSGYNKEHKEVH